jgi:dTDP-4-amino-4,6-dideoxygalactose transaminase
MKKIPFSPPDITDGDINEVVDTLKSGWITTGNKTSQFEQSLCEYTNVAGVKCLNSATAGLELILRLFGIGEGDEVITTPYTFCATANVILHTGATPVFVDIEKEGFNVSAEEIERAVTKRTKAVIAVDFAGFPADYDKIREILDNAHKVFIPSRGTMQERLSRPLLIADAAHSLGAVYKCKKSGSLADFSVFSFHAVKNLTTAEGGAVCFNGIGGLSADEIYKALSLLSLHGQDKSAYDKFSKGDWRYSVEVAGYKYNITDIASSLGLSQLRRYETEILPNRKALYESYVSLLQDNERFIIPVCRDTFRESSYHLFPLRIEGLTEDGRDNLIRKMAEDGVSANVHYIPLPMHPLYKKLGYRIEDYPRAYEAYKNEITLPLYSKMSIEDTEYVCEVLKKSLG